MIKKGTYVNIADNSGAKIGQCICIYKNHSSAAIGGLILVALKKVANSNYKEIKKSAMIKAVVVRTKYNYQRKDGSAIGFIDNAVVLVKEDLSPIANKINGFVLKELQIPKYSKLFSIAKDVL